MRLCESCSRRHWRAKINKGTGLQIKHANGNLVYICINCGHVQEEDDPVIPISERIGANVLYIDVETSKSVYYNYGARVPSKYLNIENLISEWYMMGWAASYVGSDKVFSQVLLPREAKAGDDSDLVIRLHALMDAAEVIAGHNCDNFDLKRCNTRFKLNGLPSIVGKKTIDTLKLARSKYAFESNRLDYICQRLGIDGKDHIDNQDWINAMNGDGATLEKIHKYNRNDVINGKAVLQELMQVANKKYRWGAKVGCVAQLPTKEKK
jgi:hypothetical protein